MEQIIGVIFPLSKEAIDFMFSNNRDVYIKYTSRQPTKKSKIKIKEGTTLFIYQSGGSKSVVGEAIIIKFDFLDMDTILNRYHGRLMISEEELKLYAKSRENKKALVLELKELIRYKNGIKLRKPLTMAGIFLTPEKKQELFMDE
ncbi:MAG: DUF365 domain-containing protein [Candidatus Methanoperedens sp.]